MSQANNPGYLRSGAFKQDYSVSEREDLKDPQDPQNSPKPKQSSPLSIKRRKSSFNSADSPYARRRSFLSKSMLEHDTFQTYELSGYDTFASSYDSSRSPTQSHHRIPSFSINLSESQGFIWNQDLFASSYQQARAGLDSTAFQGSANPVEVIDIEVDSSSDDLDDESAVQAVSAAPTEPKSRRLPLPAGKRGFRKRQHAKVSVDIDDGVFVHEEY